ncbi:MAG: ABC transporter permease [Candidatus Dormibacteria bacterium]
MSATVSSRSAGGLGAGAIAEVRDVGLHYELLRMLVIKDLKIKYKASNIGLLWSLLNPLLLMAVYTTIFGTIFKGSLPQFPVFIMSGLLAWNFYATALPYATVAIVGNANLVRKMRFPTSLLPVSVVLSNAINFLISLVLMFGLMAFYRHPVGPSLVLLPVLILAQTVFTIGLSLVLSSLNVFFRDIEHFLGIALTLWFFATPIIYPRSQVANKSHLAATLLKLNPMTWLISSYQDIFYGRVELVNGHPQVFVAWPNPVPLLGFIVLAVALLGVGLVLFARLSRRFTEEV